MPDLQGDLSFCALPHILLNLMLVVEYAVGMFVYVCHIVRQAIASMTIEWAHRLLADGRHAFVVPCYLLIGVVEIF